ncbi:DUF3551 domain-containing protein [Bradyrhizobium sp. CCGUVB1N3]|uniref:DUF3551 domain-containing protein n=1 Tax=Bradyrhizobium sp. CCGUVB1N3 TaxID=2949629 RepID=UPI0020B2F927|nr:DUF3551 domain-containing protein [Bradyrhizobium sp. CCGUVB1N3]MCP3473085.1 DUF3551 domain-containing protein [Bradyrhizobium sp. CCGUVB1N3]
MRIPLLTIIAIATLQAAAPASAQRYDPRYPVCMHVYTGGLRGGGGSDWFDCSFTSLEQCRASASGRGLTCDVNPYYGYDQPQPRRRYKQAY